MTRGQQELETEKQTNKQNQHSKHFLILHFPSQQWLERATAGSQQELLRGQYFFVVLWLGVFVFFF